MLPFAPSWTRPEQNIVGIERLCVHIQNNGSMTCMLRLRTVIRTETSLVYNPRGRRQLELQQQQQKTCLCE